MPTTIIQNSSGKIISCDYDDNNRPINIEIWESKKLDIKQLPESELIETIDKLSKRDGKAVLK